MRGLTLVLASVLLDATRVAIASLPTTSPQIPFEPMPNRFWSHAGARGPSTVSSKPWLLSHRSTDSASYDLPPVPPTPDVHDFTDSHVGNLYLPHHGGSCVITTAIPEPTTLTLLAGSLALLARTRQRHYK
jgi:hypothetical protein